MIDFLVLGAGGAVPTPTHSPAAYWVVVDGHGILLDPGPGALVRLVRSPHGPDSLDQLTTVLLTHLHLDHCADLAPLLFALHSPLLASTEPLYLIGPEGLATYLRRLSELYGQWIEPYQRRLVVRELAPGDAMDPAAPDHKPDREPDRKPDRGLKCGPAATAGGEPQGASVTAFAAAHPEDRFGRYCLGFQFRDAAGHCAVFSGDSEPCPALEEASRHADLLVVECSTPDEWAMAGHMTPTRVAELCRRAQPQLVVLTHQYPPAAELDLPDLIGSGYAGPVIAAQDGTLVRIGADRNDAPGTGQEDSHDTQ